MHSYYSKPRRSFSKVLALLLTITLGCCLWFLLPLRTPEESLRLGFAALEEGDLVRATKDFSHCESHPSLAHWAILGLGQAAERSRNWDDAREYYRRIGEDSASWPDASLGLLRIALENDQLFENPGELGALVSRLELLLPKIRRKDLLPSLLYQRARLAVAAKDLVSSASILMELRKRYPKSVEATLSRTLLESVREELQLGDSSLPLAQAIEEIKLLLLANQTEAALRLIYSLKTDLQENTPSYFKLLVLEEQALRTMGRLSEADHTLAIVSADGDNDSAAQALFKMSKLAWNINDHQRALGFLENFKERFARNELIPEVLYIEGRIYEEKQTFPEAKNRYNHLRLNYINSSQSCKALLRLSWIYLLEENFDLAAQHFADTAKCSRSHLLLEADYSGEFFKLSEHARFWLNYSLLKLDPEELEVSSKKISKNVSKEELTAEFSDSYYRMLSRELFPSSGQKKVSEATAELQATCEESIPASIKKTLTLLKSAGLGNLGQKEIDYSLGTLARESDSIVDRAEMEFKRSLWYEVGADLSSTVKQARYAMQLAFRERVLRGWSSMDGEKPSTSACLSKLEKLIYPLPYRDTIKKVSEETDVSQALLYAITHTESHFDPNAISNKNARGLMQLLPKTAELEGFSGKELELFLPDNNILYGGRHIERLLKRYQGVKPVAVAAYNAGPTATDRWLSRHPGLETIYWIELISYPETKDYVKKVLAAEFNYESRLKDEANSK